MAKDKSKKESYVVEEYPHAGHEMVDASFPPNTSWIMHEHGSFFTKLFLTDSAECSRDSKQI